MRPEVENTRTGCTSSAPSATAALGPAYGFAAGVTLAIFFPLEERLCRARSYNAAAMTGNPLDLRAWLAQVGELGELKDVRGADWNLELGAISELNVKKPLPPALLFDEIKGYPRGFRVLTCSTSSPARLSSILRLPVQKTHRGLVEALRGRPAQWQKDAGAFNPEVGKTGKVFENIQKSPDLLKFPSPLWHEMDGGRYIGTGCSVVTRDLDSDWVNVGTYRIQIFDKDHVCLDMVTGKHGRIHY